ncbi:MAG: prephenate dehydrogenase/arogenate dehydrogenase family protein [Pelagibacteraceae bacterium]|jgi:cyclohexadieny/prephenate dehydrogenase
MKNISIIGIGLIGSSLARAVKQYDSEILIHVVDSSFENLEKSKNLSLADSYNTEINKEVEVSEVVFICTPISAYEKIFKDLKKFNLNKSIITDVGSSKLEVIGLAKKFLKDKIFVPGHPIAGTEKSGPENGFKDLFKNKWFISTTSELCDTSHIKIINDFWKNLGSKVETMSPKDHDSIMAITSHIPHLIAYNIVGTASELEDDIKSEVIKFSASGFRDFTRIASSDPIMWRDIMLSNKVEIISLLEKFNNDLLKTLDAIKNNDGKYLLEKFKKTKEIRKKIIEAGLDKN